MYVHKSNEVQRDNVALTLLTVTRFFPPRLSQETLRLDTTDVVAFAHVCSRVLCCCFTGESNMFFVLFFRLNICLPKLSYFANRPGRGSQITCL